MENLNRFISGTKLFNGIAAADTARLLGCLHAVRVRYSGGQWILREEQSVTSFGLMLSGRGRAVKEGFDGRPVLISLLGPGSEIGILLAAVPGRRSPVSVQAVEEAEVLSIPFSSLISRCHKNCPGHDRLLQNYLAAVAEKGLLLHQRMDCLLKPTVREKVLSYLRRFGQKSFKVPLDRAAMAEYLNVDRSALSRELSKMKKEGILDYHKNSFRFL